MYKLLRFLKSYKKESILGPLFKLLEASFELLVPLVVAAIIDKGIGGSDRGYTVKMCLLLAALGVVGLISSVTAQFFAAKAAVGFAEKVRHALFNHIQSLSYSDIDSLGTTTLVTRMTSDMNQVQYGVNMTLRLLLRSPFVVFGAMIMAFTVNEALTDAQKFVGRISALMNPVTLVIINGSIIALVYIGALRVDQGIITQGAVVALYNYMSQILVELIKLANLIISVTKSIACGNRIQAVLDIQPSMVFPSGVTASLGDPSSEYCVEFRHADLRYGNSGENALTDINFRVKRGETVGVIGGTGSGKSSLVHMIPRFYDTFAGEVLVDGVNVKEYTRQALREKVGMVPQKAVLFKGTIRDNMLWGNPSASDEEINAAITTAQAAEVVAGKEDGLDYMIAQGGKNLSGGQRQRLTIARALIRKPEILILDDSASALDFATDAALRKAIKAMDGSPTVFIVSQRAASIAHADKIIVLDDGRIVGMGKHDDLLKNCDVYREIYHSQFSSEKSGKEGAK